MKIQELKKETGLTQKDIAQFFNMTYGAFANSSAKERYENALCNFYSFLRGEKEKKTGEQHEPNNEAKSQPCNIYDVSFSEERAEVCTCQDPENGFKSNDCPIHHWKYDNSLFKQT